MALSYMTDHPERCIDTKRKGRKTCIGCYASQVENGVFTGSMECFNSECVCGNFPFERFPDENTLVKNGYLIKELERACRR